MTIKLQKSKLNLSSNLTITGSKSESNRLLLLQALYPKLHIENISNSDDSRLMQNAINSESNCIDIHHAGTAMRFLTAYFSIQRNKKVIITGSTRMTERPIKILVDALKDLGADISYLEKEGFPPLQILGRNLDISKVKLKSNVSSQYISALLLIASKLKNGLELHLEGVVTSKPYIEMTLALLNEIGIETSFEQNKITVQSQGEVSSKTIVVESDWSSASYFYSCIALSKIGTEITLNTYKEKSLQGDSILIEIYKSFGVETVCANHQITLKKVAPTSKEFNYDLKNAPDIAQTIAVTCLGLGSTCILTGLHTLKIKETDRLAALKAEIEKLGGRVTISDTSLQLSSTLKLKADVEISTYNDHRMAMAFAPLALKTPIKIEDAEVVSKSYPDFWEDLKTIGFKFSK